MAYRRNWRANWSSNQPTKVTVHWSVKSSAYAIKFEDTAHWNEMQLFITYLKNVPYGERDYDPDNKVWYLMEKHIDLFREMLKGMSQYFTEDFQGKPEGQTFSGQFISIDTYLDKFKSYSGEEIRSLEYDKAKKIYRRVCLQNHPDRGGDSKLMSEINECWSQIERLYFNQKKEPEYAT